MSTEYLILILVLVFGLGCALADGATRANADPEPQALKGLLGSDEKPVYPDEPRDPTYTPAGR